MDEKYLKPTQADRDAAARLGVHLGWAREVIDAVANGERDYWPTVQALARHRLAHSPDSLNPEAPDPLSTGWSYLNEDTGREWAPNHPVESGEVPDATEVEPMTFGEFDARYPAEAPVAPLNPEALRPLVEALEELLRTGLNGGNNVRLAYIAAGRRELSDELLAKAEASEQAVQRARAALTLARTSQDGGEGK